MHLGLIYQVFKLIVARCSKTVGADVAILTILAATRVALASLGQHDLVEALEHHQVFGKVWLGLAGIGHQSDVDAFAPLVRKAFNIAEDDECALRITNGMWIVYMHSYVAADLVSR